MLLIMTPVIRFRRNRLRAAFELGAAGLMGLLLLSACTMKQHVILSSDGSGNAQFRVVIDKSLMDAAAGLSPGSSAREKPGEFDIPKIKKIFAKNTSLKLESLTSPSAGVLTGSFTFTDIGALFQGASGSSPGGIITYSKGPSGNVLKIHITRANFADIANLAGMTTNPLYQMFGPEQNATTSADDLNQMMVYVLGNSGPAALKASSIDVVVSVDGRITGQTGGVREGKNVHFHIPLVRLLLLARPLDYSVTFS